MPEPKTPAAPAAKKNRVGAASKGDSIQPATTQKPAMPPEFGGPAGPEPTRYGDWERKGRVSDF